MLAPDHLDPVDTFLLLFGRRAHPGGTGVELLTPCLGLGSRVAGLRIRQQAEEAEAAVVVLRAPLETQIATEHHRHKGSLRRPAVWGRGARCGADPGALEQQTFCWGGALLIKRVPPITAGADADLLQLHQREPFRAERLTGLAPVRLDGAGGRELDLLLGQFSNGRQVQHLPALRGLAALLLQQPADQVVLVPAGQHHHLGRACKTPSRGPLRGWFSAGEPDGLEPLDQLLALAGGVGIFWTLVGVIDDPQRVALAGERPAHAGGDAATALGGEPVANGGGVLGEGMADSAVVMPCLTAMGVGQLGRIGGDGAEPRGVAAHPVGREQLGDEQ